MVCPNSSSSGCKYMFRKFCNVSSHPWCVGCSLSQHRRLMDWLGKKHLHVTQYHHWHNLSHRDFLQLGAKPLLTHHYNMSTASLLRSVYPEYNWFFLTNNNSTHNSNRRSWGSIGHQRAYFDSLLSSSQLQLHKEEAEEEEEEGKM